MRHDNHIAGACHIEDDKIYIWYYDVFVCYSSIKLKLYFVNQYNLISLFYSIYRNRSLI